jgi:predicted nucleotidyltransferase
MTESEIHSSVERAVTALKKAGAREVYIFGSAATGKIHEHSDLDLAVSGLLPERFFRAMAQASRALGGSLDLVDLDHDTPFARYLKEEGELQRVG